MVKIKISQRKCFTTLVLAFLYIFILLLRWVLLCAAGCAGVSVYRVFFIPFAAARRLVLSKELFSRGTTRQIAHERLWLLQLHVNYNFIESIWCIIFLSSRARCLPMGAERGLVDSTPAIIISLLFFISNRTILWISNFSTNNKSYVYIFEYNTHAAMLLPTHTANFKSVTHSHKSVYIYYNRSHDEFSK